MPTHSTPFPEGSPANVANSGNGSSQATRRSTEFYAPALDGLRCFAVLGVLFVHFSPTLRGMMDTGSWGVRLFFVLSGFLITRSLLQTRKHVDAGQTSIQSALRAFFIRRIFRLWPVYFFCLAIAYAFTGNLVISGSVAGTDALSKIALYYLHERLWDRVRPT